MIGALLDHHVAGFHVHFRIVEQHVDLAFENDGVIDALRTVHVGMPGGRCRVAEAHFLQHGGVVDRPGVLLRREIDDAQHAAIRRRGDAALALGAVIVSRNVGRRLVRRPQQGRDDLADIADAAVGRGAIHEHDGLAFRVVPGDDAPHMRLHVSSF